MPAKKNLSIQELEDQIKSKTAEVERLKALGGLKKTRISEYEKMNKEYKELGDKMREMRKEFKKDYGESLV